MVENIEYKVEAECPGDMAVLGVTAPAGVVIRTEVAKAIINRGAELVSQIKKNGYYSVVDSKLEFPAQSVDSEGFGLMKTVGLKWRISAYSDGSVYIETRFGFGKHRVFAYIGKVSLQ